MAGPGWNNKPNQSGKLSRSGFRWNIAKCSRWTKDTVEGLPAFREGYDAIDWSKKKTEEQKEDGDAKV